MEMAGRNSTLLLLFAFVFFILLLQRPVFATKEAFFWILLPQRLNLFDGLRLVGFVVCAGLCGVPRRALA